MATFNYTDKVKDLLLLLDYVLFTVVRSALSLKRTLKPLRTMPTVYNPVKEVISKHCDKKRNSINQHFLLFPRCFSNISTFKLSSANVFCLDNSAVL